MAKKETKDFQQSINTVQIVGAIEEINLKVEDEVKNKDTGKIDKRGARISVKEFKNPAFTIKSGDGVFGVNIIPTYEKTEKDGELVDNPKFKALKTIMGYEKGTRVKVDAQFTENGYAGQDGTFKSDTRLTMFSMTSSGVDDKDSAEAKVSGIIKSIKEETINDEETGRLKVELYMIDYTGATFPIELTVEESLKGKDDDGNAFEITAEDFADAYEKLNSVILNVELVTKVVGGSKSEEKLAFGRKSKIQRGFTKTEYRVVGGSPVIEEPDEDEPKSDDKYYISREQIKKLLADRDVMIEAKLEEKKNGKSSASDDTSKKGLGRKSKVEDVDDIEDDPFN